MSVFKSNMISLWACGHQVSALCDREGSSSPNFQGFMLIVHLHFRIIIIHSSLSEHLKMVLSSFFLSFFTFLFFFSNNGHRKAVNNTPVGDLHNQCNPVNSNSLALSDLA